MEINEIMAANLKTLRTERSLSLGQLAELSGVSKVMLSQIEKGETNPTLNTVWKIANGLKVPYTRLIDKAKNDTVVIRKSPCLEQNSEEATHRVFCYYQTTPTRNFELFSAELDANSEHESVGHCEKSQEYILVNSGELTLKTGDQVYVLHKGDSIFFDPTEHHWYINNSDGLTEYTIVIFYS
jgi:transcriptional regulator with XRE-family HTH domain